MALPPVPRRTAQPTRNMGTPTNSPPPATPNVGDYSARQVNMGAQMAQPAPGQSQQMRNPNAPAGGFGAPVQQAPDAITQSPQLIMPRRNTVSPKSAKPMPPMNRATAGIMPNQGGVNGPITPPQLAPIQAANATDRGIVPPAVSPQTNLGDPTGQLPVPGLLQDMPPRGYGR